MEQKQQKINQLRGLLVSARNKLLEYKTQLQQKDKQFIQYKQNQAKKTKQFQTQSQQMMKQYEERLLRLTRSLEDSDRLVAKWQLQCQLNNKTHENTLKKIDCVIQSLQKMFPQTINKVVSSNNINGKNSNQAVEQLCQLERCKQLENQINQIQQNSSDITQINTLNNSIRKLVLLYSNCIGRKRQCRLGFLKRQSKFNKQLQQYIKNIEQSKKQSTYQISIVQYQDQKNKIKICTYFMDKYRTQNYEVKLQKTQNKNIKGAQEQTSRELVKQLLIKMLNGPRDASKMALQVLAKVLNMKNQEYNICLKKIN